MIAQGAEARLYRKGNKLIKERIPKHYRIQQLDDALRKSRTRREAKVLESLPQTVNAPALHDMDDEKMILVMEFIDGPRVRDVLEGDLDLCETIGTQIAAMHRAGIIHGDLTTSNMVAAQGKVYMIDFGLSFFSDKTEDKAVDLHVLKEALESTHPQIYTEAFRRIAEHYGDKKVLKRLEKVENRGRNKKKG